MPASDIVIKGAREHNLQNVSLKLPRNQLICLTGVSGSGKSSLAFDTLYAEGQRRYVESLSTFARQFLGQMPKPDVDHISGLSPSISISQKTSGRNPRSTVGTITEIYDYLRVLYARVGQGHCPTCSRPITAQSREQIIGRILTLPAKTKFVVLAPVIRQQKGEFRDLFIDLLKQGFVNARVDGEFVSLSDVPALDRQMRHSVEVVIDRMKMDNSVRGRLAEAVDVALDKGDGSLVIALEDQEAGAELDNDQVTEEEFIEEANTAAATEENLDLHQEDEEEAFEDEADFEEDEEQLAFMRRTKKASRNGLQPGDIAFSAQFACTHCGLSFEAPTPQMFSFNSPQGMCLDCDGMGEYYSFDPEVLLTHPEKSLSKGTMEIVGKWKDLTKWKRHIFKGVATTLERKYEIEEGTLLETPWQDLSQEHQKMWLWGTGDEHITFTWRSGRAAQKYGGQFEGIIPDLLEKYRSCKNSRQTKYYEKYMNVIGCPGCAGRRLNPQSQAVVVTSSSAQFKGKPGLSLPEVCQLPINEAIEFFTSLELSPTQHMIASEVLKEICGRLGFLMNVGLDYLTLERTAPTLSGGESQRIRLAGQIGCGLVGVLYILDEPSIGLHPRDNDRLLNTLEQLRDLGNTVVVVEHDEDTMNAADHIIDFGPGPGIRGGEVVAEGTAEEVMQEPRSVTGAFLSGKRKIKIPATRALPSIWATDEEWASSAERMQEIVSKKRGGRRKKKLSDEEALAADEKTERTKSWLDIARHGYPCVSVLGAKHNNLKGIDVDIPLGAFVCVTGASGSGKSSIVNDILSERLRIELMNGKGEPGTHQRMEGIDNLDKLIAIDQSPIGRTPRSNPATYIKVFDDIRTLYAMLPDAKKRGYKPGRFSFNVAGGRCEACDGNGSNKLEMDFLADVWVECPICEGHRFNRETLQVLYKGKSISDVLEMDIQQALKHFENIPNIVHKLDTLHAVGLDYLKLGQPSPTLSGGEAQRIKLARELVKKSTGRTLYLLDEPTTGLHFADIELLLKVLHDFVDAGNSVLVIEHNMDVVKTADWVVDIGPEGGKDGGYLVMNGTPEDVARYAEKYHLELNNQPVPEGYDFETTHVSFTGDALMPLLPDTQNSPAIELIKPVIEKKQTKTAKDTTHITVEGARQHNLRNVNAMIPRDQMTVFCGPSGSGKTSLAMDTIYAEGQRRYVESLSSYARQFVGQMQKPALDYIDGLSPAIAIEQRVMGHSPRSTVGTVTEIYDYFRILYARLGDPYCPECDTIIGTQTPDQIVDKVMAEKEGTKIYLMAPVELQSGERYETLWESLQASGYQRIRVDGETYPIEKAPLVDRRRKHEVEIVVDRIVIKQEGRGRIAESVEICLALGKGLLHVAYPAEGVPEKRWEHKIHSQHLVCDGCGRSFEPLSPHSFSFNSSMGWCKSCEGLGTQTGADPAEMFRDMAMPLKEGAMLIWPSVGSDLSRRMLAALSKHTGLPIDISYLELSPKQRRILLYGTGDDWISVYGPKAKKTDFPLFGFQFKGLYPALEAASKLSVSLRMRLDSLVSEIECSECAGSRLRDDASAVRYKGHTINNICGMQLGVLLKAMKKWKLTGKEKRVAGELVAEVISRLTFLIDVGLDYLTVNRKAPSLSGGEAQRIRLASQVGSGLCGVLYVLDEPTIGLHPRDNKRLISALLKLRDLGNTLLVVEHDREVLNSADQVLDFGPQSGRFGGEIVARGTPEEVGKMENSVTGPYLSGTKGIEIPLNRRIAPRLVADISDMNQLREEDPMIGEPANMFRWLEIQGARHHNLKNIEVAIPLGAFTAITGPSGSGKSSLIEDILYAQLAKSLHRAGTSPGTHDKIVGMEFVNKVIRVDQRPLGNSPTSNPATYTGLFDLIRELFAQLPESKLRGYTARRFSFNVSGGRCDGCDGVGQQCIEMHFLPDVWVPCETCEGQRYNPETLSVKYHGKSVADVLAMSCEEAVKLFTNIPKIRRVLQVLCDVGLGYVTLGQSAPTLSGGEAQRVKLAAELSRPDTGQTLYLLDEPTTGLHFDDLTKLLDVLNRLVDMGNTVVVIEHNLDVIKTADWVVDIGPEAGEEGGQLVCCGTPEMVVAHAEANRNRKRVPKRTTDIGDKEILDRIPQSVGEVLGRIPQTTYRSYTGEALAPILAEGPYEKRDLYDPASEDAPRKTDLEIEEVGEDVKMPWEKNGRQWHTQDRVSHSGESSEWDGSILDKVERKIHEFGLFSETNWNTRSVVEICAQKKSDGWFFHAITGDKWVVKLKFRTAKRTFDRIKLVESLGLKPFDELEDVQAYGRQPRVKCKNLRGPWQEIEIQAFSWEEIDTPEFWSFLQKSIKGFLEFTHRFERRPEEVMPWKVLGQKWHLSRRGFPPGKKVQWQTELLEELLGKIIEVSPLGDVLWNNQQVVHLMLPERTEPWASVYTKRLAGLDLVLNGPKGAFALGSVSKYGVERSLNKESEDRDQIKLRFRTMEDLGETLVDFLEEHREAVLSPKPEPERVIYRPT